ncbi:MAG: endonuclease, partial [Moorea sp. SIO4G2]|nr:endonuclease [Moorena sp. SIO4G2]
REQLRQWYKEKSHKYGRKRQEIEVSESKAFLLLWILSWWSSDEKSLVLAADASTLGKRIERLGN